MEKNEYKKNFFVFCSDNLTSVQSKLFGFCVDTSGIIYDEDIINIDDFRPNGTGSYIYIKKDGNYINIYQDFIGSQGIYLYKDKDYFTISNSLFYLTDFLGETQHKLTLNEDYANQLLTADMVPVTVRETIFNEIELIDRNINLIIDIKKKRLNFEREDYGENSVSLDSDLGIKKLDLWHEKWRTIVKSVVNSNCYLSADLSGGFDTRMVMTILLSSKIDMSRVKIITSTDGLSCHPEDLQIATAISKHYGFELNSNKIVPPKSEPITCEDAIGMSFYTKLTFHKQMYYNLRNYTERVFAFTGGAGEIVRSGIWDVSPTEFKKDIIKACNKLTHLEKVIESTSRVIDRALRETADINKKIKNINLPWLLYREARTRHHYGKDMFEHYLVNQIKLLPIIDPDIQMLSLTTKKCNDKNLIPAIIFSRYCPDMLKFPIEGGRSISKETIKQAMEINKIYPYKVNTDIITINVKKDISIYDKFTVNNIIPLTNKSIHDSVMKLFNSNWIKRPIIKMYDERTYEHMKSKITKTKYFPLQPAHTIIGISLASRIAAMSGRECQYTIQDFFDDNLTFENQSEFGRHFYNSLKLISSKEPFRIDIFNNGSKENYISVINALSNDKYDINISTPEWAQKDGFGMMCITQSEHIELKLRIVNKGEFSVYIKGSDIRTNRGDRIPCLNRLKRLQINRNTVFEGDKIVWHDGFLCYKKDVKDGEIIKISVEMEKY